METGEEFVRVVETGSLGKKWRGEERKRKPLGKTYNGGEM